MRSRAKTFVAAIAITGLAVVGTDAVTYAGTGNSLILGKINKSKQTTHIKSTGKGPALALHAKGTRPALSVDSKAKIARLNADRVDGRSAAGLQNNVRVFTANAGATTDGSMMFRLPNFPKGRYQVTYDVLMSGSAGSETDPTSGNCWLRKSGTSVYAGTTSTTSVFNNIGLSGSGVITKDRRDWVLTCELYQPGLGYKAWTIPAYQPVRVTLTRIDNTIGGRMIGKRTGPNADRPGER